MKYTEDSESPDLFHKWAAVSTIASTTTRLTYVTRGHHKFYLNFWILLVAPPGVCRKSDPINASRSLIEGFDHIHLASESLTREYLLNLFAASRKRFIKMLAEKYDYATAEKMAPSALTVHSSEFGVFLGQGDVRFLNDLTDIFDCKAQWRYGTIKRDQVVLDNTWLNILGAITPGSIQEVLPDFAINGGFLSRFILVNGTHKRKRVSLMDVKPKDVELFNALRSDLELISKARGDMQFSDEAASAYTRWYDRFDELDPPGGDPRLVYYNSRKPTHLINLCGVVSLSKSNSMVISAEDFKEALMLLSETERNMASALVGVGKNKLAPLIANLDRTIKKMKIVTHKELTKLYSYDATPSELKDALETLASRGTIKPTRLNGLLSYKFIASNKRSR